MSDNTLNKFRMLTEYAFINNKSLYEPKDKLDSTLLEDDEDPMDDMDSFSDDPTSDKDKDNEELGDAIDDAGMEDNEMDAEEGDLEGGQDIEPAVEPQPGDEEPAMDDVETSSDGDIELDITDIVTDTQEAKESSDMANQKIDSLIQSIDALIQNSSKIDTIAQRMDTMEKEFIKRNPTRDEKLEMQSLHSAPYNVKLGDYWSEKTDYISDISDNDTSFNNIDNTEEIRVTQDDIDDTYSELDARDSFDFDEEEVEDYDI